jgi:hypothetical protein
MLEGALHSLLQAAHRSCSMRDVALGGMKQAKLHIKNTIYLFLLSNLVFSQFNRAGKKEKFLPAKCPAKNY